MIGSWTNIQLILFFSAYIGRKKSPIPFEITLANRKV